MPGPVQQMTAAHSRAGVVLHALEAAGALIHAQSLLPAMNMHGTSIVRPENSCSSRLSLPPVEQRYHITVIRAVPPGGAPVASLVRRNPVKPGQSQEQEA